MKQMKYRFKPLLLLGLALLVLAGCDEFKQPDLVFDPNKEGAADPVIQVIDPVVAYSGHTEMVISGDHFSPQIEGNSVYFGTELGTIVSTTANEIRVIPPDFVSDSVEVRVVVSPDAYYYASYQYIALESVDEIYAQQGRISSFAVDAQDNLYLHNASSSIVFMDTNGDTATVGYTDFTTSCCMRFAPDGHLYIQRKNNRPMARFTRNGEAEQFVRFRKGVAGFDVDENNYFYCAGRRSGVFVVSPEGDITTVEKYKSESITAVRVYDGYVYFAADGTGIYRNQILDAQGSLGDDELYLDWTQVTDYASSDINDITFSSAGDLFVATDHDNPLLVVHPDGQAEALFPGVLASPVVNFYWGGQERLYLNNGVDQIVRLVVDYGVPSNPEYQMSAPYYGRNDFND